MLISRRLVENPYLNLLSGLVLVITAGYESWDALGEGLGAHHGVLLFGLIHVIQNVPELVHGIKEVREAEEEFAGGNDS